MTSSTLVVALAVIFPLLFALAGVPIIYCICCKSYSFDCCRRRKKYVSPFVPDDPSVVIERVSNRHESQSYMAPISAAHHQEVEMKRQPAPSLGIPSLPGTQRYHDGQSQSSYRNEIGFRPLNEITKHKYDSSRSHRSHRSETAGAEIEEEIDT